MARKGQKYSEKELQSLMKRKQIYYEKLSNKVLDDYKKGMSINRLSYKYHSRPSTIRNSLLYYEEVNNVKILRT